MEANKRRMRRRADKSQAGVSHQGKANEAVQVSKLKVRLRFYLDARRHFNLSVGTRSWVAGNILLMRDFLRVPYFTASGGLRVRWSFQWSLENRIFFCLILRGGQGRNILWHFCSYKISVTLRYNRTTPFFVRKLRFNACEVRLNPKENDKWHLIHISW